VKIKYIGGFPEVEIADTGQIVEQGKTVEVDDDLGKSLIEQSDNWEKVTDRKKKET
jgi:hypothetical protein